MGRGKEQHRLRKVHSKLALSPAYQVETPCKVTRALKLHRMAHQSHNKVDFNLLKTQGRPRARMV